jgi:hypothetical protein
VFSIVALLKVGSGAKQAPAEELMTGSIQRSPAGDTRSSSDPIAFVLRPTTSEAIPGSIQRSPAGDTRSSSDPIAFVLRPTTSETIPRPVQNAVVVRKLVPLPHPRPNRL